MPRWAQDLGNEIYAAHITWRQVGPLARYFNAYAFYQAGPRQRRARLCSPGILRKHWGETGGTPTSTI